ncbi:MAG: Holliday junction DNA helicase RuvA [Deltaproteobacteria bacterium GWC2_56_8]|nr:MAG: Holliday junction DNA helicase RuvA [Deltaproteobacteria bacterium GWB2_55_19]OGP36614.1 MAG: Holliday junction DNA helicase RuvA [Deltaproteobacteria bacterium GWC2_56_8]HAO93369.1 Holliday junction branch migration protein RuvA [Deltaproteobacteria bacterium]
MIAYIKGALKFKTTESAIVDVNGVGYELFIPLSTFCNLPDEGGLVDLYVHTQLKEDAIQLYGFLTPEEKAAFQLLISVTGVGPKLARNILSGIPVADLVNAIGSSDKARLSTIPGIGAKSAERLILELKDKVKNLSKTGVKEAEPRLKDTLSNDIISALENLGYKVAQAEEAVRKARALLPQSPFEAIFKEALKFLSRKQA